MIIKHISDLSYPPTARCNDNMNSKYYASNVALKAGEWIPVVDIDTFLGVLPVASSSSSNKTYYI